MPTDPVEPDHWTLPVWVAVPPAAIAAFALLGGGLALALAWTEDNLSSSLAARAALRSDSEKAVPLDTTVRIETRWWRTTAVHMVLWSAAIERSPEASTRADEVGDALDSARRAAPLQASARYATARSGAETGSTTPGPALGLSRDVSAMALTGRMLKQAGKVEQSLWAYRRALELAAEIEPPRLDAPTFDDDPKVRRFRLPHEEIVGVVIRDMMAAGDWGFAQWSAAIPPRAVVRLSAARLLREKGNPDVERALDLVLADDVEAPASPGAASEHHAARAEALALAERKAEAAVSYRKAIDLARDDPTRRRWRLALAEVLVSPAESRERSEMLEAAKGTDPSDEVTKKALDAQKFAGLK